MLLRYFVAFLIVWCYSSAVGFCQQGPFTLSGHVSAENGEALPSVNIVLDEATIKVTDDHGDFKIPNLKRGKHKLLFLYVGFDSLWLEVEINDKSLHIDVVMKENLQQLFEVIVVGDHFRTGRVEQSMTIQSIDQEFLKIQNSGTLINSMQKLPGINAINTGVGISKPVIRGMSFNRVMVLDKGIKQEGQQWGADHGLEIDQYDPEGIEVIKGPSSLLYGSDGIGGVIRILPPEITTEDHFGGDAFLTYKSNNDLFGGSVKLQGKKDHVFFRGRLSYQDFADYRVPANNFTYNGTIIPIYNNRLKNTAGNEQNINLTGGYINSKFKTSLTISNFNQKAGLMSGSTGIPREYDQDPDGDDRNIDLPRQRINHFKVISNTTVFYKKSWLDMDFGYQFNDRKEEGAPHAHGYQPTPEGDLALGLQLQTLTANVKLNQTLGDKFQNIIGIQSQYQSNSHSGFEFLLPDYSAFQIGGFVYSEFTPGHDYSFNVGIRYDYGNRDIEEKIEPDYTTPSEEDSIVRNGAVYRDFHDVSAAFGFSYYPNQKFNVKANLGTSFRMPTVAELASNGVHHGTFRHEKGDSTLSSERGVQIDLNFTYSWKKLYFTASPFFGYFYNYIYLKPMPEFSNLPAGGQLYQYTQNDALFTGFEALMEYNLFRNWKINSGAEYVWNKNLDSRRPLPFTPPFSIFGEIQYMHHVKNKKLNHWSIAANYHFYAEQKRVDTNENPTPGYGLLNANLSTKWKFNTQEITLAISGQNLLNTEYLNHLSRYRLLNLVEQGRNIVLSVQIPF